MVTQFDFDSSAVHLDIFLFYYLFVWVNIHYEEELGNINKNLIDFSGIIFSG